jgi:hypothetical protein
MEKEFSETTMKHVKKEEIGENQCDHQTKQTLDPSNELEIADLQGPLMKAQLIIDIVRAFGGDPITLVNDMTLLLMQTKRKIK